MSILLFIFLLLSIGACAYLFMQKEKLRLTTNIEAKNIADEIINEWKIKELNILKEEYNDKVYTVQKEYQELSRQSAKNMFEDWKNDSEKKIRKDAIDRSKSVTVGKITEHLIPYFPDFHFNPKDARFIGSPIDFIVFDGLDEGAIRKIVFLEIKTGTSSLSSRERQIRDAIKNKNVEWEELRPNG